MIYRSNTWVNKHNTMNISRLLDAFDLQNLGNWQEFWAQFQGSLRPDATPVSRHKASQPTTYSLKNDSNNIRQKSKRNKSKEAVSLWLHQCGTQLDINLTSDITHFLCRWNGKWLTLQEFHQKTVYFEPVGFVLPISHVGGVCIIIKYNLHKDSRFYKLNLIRYLPLREMPPRIRHGTMDYSCIRLTYKSTIYMGCGEPTQFCLNKWI